MHYLVVFSVLSTCIVHSGEGFHHTGHASTFPFPLFPLAGTTRPPKKREPPGTSVEIWPGRDKSKMRGEFKKGLQQRHERFEDSVSWKRDKKKYPSFCTPHFPDNPSREIGFRGSYCLHVSVPKLYVYEGLGNEKAAIIIVPGGGGTKLAWDVEGSSYASMFLTMGYLPFVLKYRVPIMDYTPVNTYLYDIQRAIVFVRNHTGFDIVGVIGAGFSGKAVIEAANSAERAYSPVDELDELRYKPDFVVAIYPGAPQIDIMIGASSRDSPATFLVVTRDDTCTHENVSEAILAQVDPFRWLEFLFPSKTYLLSTYENGTHGYGNCLLYPELNETDVCNWPKRLETWLEPFAGAAQKMSLTLLTGLLVAASTYFSLN